VAYATAADLATYMQQPDLDAGTADLALQLVSDSIDAEVGQSLTEQTLTEELLDGPLPGSSTLILPSYPVTSVTAVSVMERLGQWTDLVAQQDYLWSAKGILTRISSAYTPDNPQAPFWPRYPQSIKVSSTRGWVEVPGGVRAVCLAAAARLITNPNGVASEQIGGVRVQYSGTVDFTPMEMAALGRVREVVTA